MLTQKTNFKCCKECTPETGRHIGCHSTCEKYLSALKKYREEQKIIDKNRSLDRSYYEFIASKNQMIHGAKGRITDNASRAMKRNEKEGK